MSPARPSVPTRRRTCKLEQLERRELLSVQPLTDFAAMEPIGSLSYRASASADLNPFEPTQSFTLELDTDQSLAASVVAPFEAEVTLTDPSGELLASVVGSAGELFLPQQLIDEAGLYTITVAAANGIPTLGTLHVTALLNASFEAERTGGSANNTAGEAETFDGVLLPVGLGDAERAVIVGRSLPFGPVFASSASQSGGLFTPNVTTLTLDATPTPIGPATLTITASADLNALGEFLTIDAEGLFVADVFITGGSQSAESVVTVEIPAGTVTQLAADGVILLNVTPSAEVDDLAPTSLEVELEYAVTPDADDWYAVSLEDGDLLSLVLDADSTALELYAADGVTLLAQGPVISGFKDSTVDGAADDYRIRVPSGTADYRLAVIRNGRLAGPAPGTPDGALALGRGSQTILGAVAAESMEQFFTFQAAAGDNLSIATTTPAAGAGDFVNELDPGVELIGPDGGVVPYANTAGDETLMETAPLAGEYTVRVFGESGSVGAYVLDIAGATGTAPAFEVTGASVVDGQRVLPGTLGSLTVDLNDAVRLDTLDTTDLLINGVPGATAVTVDDPSTLTFEFPSTLVEGEITLALPAGSLVGVAGQELEGFALSFIVDESAPRIVGSSVIAGDVVRPGVQAFTFDFDEPLDQALLSASSVELVGSRTGLQANAELDYDAAAERLTITTASLEEDTYTLRLLSEGFRDELGFELDGEIDPASTVPSGDGTPGGDFVLPLTVDTGVQGLGEFVRQSPAGSQIYEATAAGFLAPADDVDTFEVQLDAGQTIAVVVQGDIDPTVELIGPRGTPLRLATGDGVSTPAVLQAIPVLESGLYRINVGAQGGTAGAFRVNVALNAQWELEELSGAADATAATAEDLIFSTVIGSRRSTSAVRAAVTGVVSSLGPQFTATATDETPLFFPNVADVRFAQVPTPLGDATLTFAVTADLNSANEFLAIDAEGLFTANLFVTGGSQGNPTTAAVDIPQATIAELAADGVVSVTVTPSAAVDNLGATSLSVDLSFPVESVLGDDWYRLQLGDGQSASFALQGANSGVELYADDGETLLAIGRATTDGLVSIDNFVDGTDDGAAQDYFVRVAGGSGPYSLVATRGAVFDREVNDTFGAAQELTAAAGAVGFVTGPDPTGLGGDDDWYAVSLDAGDRLFSRVRLPASGPGEFENALATGIPGGVILSEVVDGAGDSGNPKFVEITNTTGAAYTFPAGGLIVQTNDGTDRNVDIDLTGVTIPARESYVVAASSNGGRDVFESIYGFSADFYADELIGDGNDRYALTDTADGSNVLDVYGVLGTNGAGTAWDYTDSYAFRLPGGAMPSGEAFVQGEWSVAGAGALDDGVTPAEDLLRTLTTPGVHDFVTANSPLARLELFDPSGVPIDGGADFVNLVAPVAGDYRLRVSALALEGEYVLEVSGATGQGVPPTVVETLPANGTLFATVPTTYTVTFSEPLLEGTVGPEDLLVNGLPATGVTMIDALTFRFDVDPSVDSGDGVYDVQLPAGAVVDLQGLGNEVFATTFVVDGSGPRILSAKIDGADLVLGVTYPAGDRTISLEFDEPLDEAVLSPGRITLSETISGQLVPLEAFNYDPITRAITLDYVGLTEGVYELYVSSGSVRDQVRNPLDGEPLGPPLDGAPTGDGVPGGDYTLAFQVDAVGAGTLLGFERLDPLGGLVSGSLANAGILNAPGDADDVVIELAAGEVLTAVVTPLDPTATLTAAALGLSGPGASPTPGAPAVLPVAASPIDTPVTIRVVGDRATAYRLDVYLNAILEAEAVDTGLASPLSIDGSLRTLPQRRYAVLGDSEPAASRTTVYQEDFNFGADGFTFDNAFGSGGGLWSLSGGRQLDGLPNHTPPGSLYFGQNEGLLGGGDYDTGAVAEGSVITPLLTLPDTGSGWLSFNQLIETDVATDVAEVSVLAGETATTVLSTVDGTLVAGSGGTWQSVEADLSAFAGQTIQLQFRFDTFDDQQNGFEGWYVDDLLVEAAGDPIADLDEYTFTVAGDAAIDVILAGQGGVDFSGALLQVIDPITGRVVAEGSADPLGIEADNYDQAVLGFTPERSGEYKLRVASPTPGQYVAVVTENLVFDSEPNSSSESPLARALTLGGAGLGFLDGDPGPGSGLFAIDATLGDFVALDPITGEEITRNAFPVFPSGGPDGLAVGGGSLFYTQATTLYELDPITGEVIDADLFASLGVPTNIDALAYYADLVVAMDYSSDRAHYIDPATDTALGSVGLPVDVIGGIAGAASRGSLFANSFGSGLIYEIDVATNTVVNSFAAADVSVLGLAFVDGSLFTGNTAGVVRRIDPDTGTVLGTFNPGFSISGLAGDEPGGVLPTFDLPPRSFDPEPAQQSDLGYDGLAATIPGEQTAGVTAAAALAKDDPLSQSIGTELAALYREFLQNESTLTPSTAFTQSGAKDRMEVDNGLVLIDAFAEGSGDVLLATLTGLGMHSGSAFGRTVSGWMPIGALAELAALPEMRFARPSFRPMTNVGLTTSQADAAMGSDIARETFGVDGSGVTVGVLSDSMGFTGTDILTGDLPGPGNPLGNTAPIVVLDDIFGSDEGRAMAQLIHDVAPGAEIAFHTAFGGQANFANGIVELRDIAGSDVIVDDVIYFAEPMFQDGIIAQAIDTVVADGASYFSSAGNTGRDSWEDAFRDSGVSRFGATLHDFDAGPGVDTLQSITVAPGASVLLSFQWDSPFFSVSGGAGTQNDVDIFVLDSLGNTLLASASTNNIGGDALEVFSFTNTTGSSSLNLAVGLAAGAAPGLMKWVAFDPFIVNEYATNSATSYGHTNAAGASAVGAANYLDTPAFGAASPGLESFSSAGGIPTLFDTAGQPINELRAKPNIVAPDGTNTTFFGFDSDFDGFPNFFGTSAAAPHAAAVAALMNELAPLASPAEIYDAMESSAIDMDDPATPGFDVGFDNGTGAGLLDAVGALSLIVADPALVGPRAVSITPEEGVTADLNVTELTIDFDEPLDAISAEDAANYELLAAGSDGIFGTTDDQVIRLSPTYDGATTVTLEVAAGVPLVVGRYRLTLQGDGQTGGIVDTDGNPLNSREGPGLGRDTTHDFEVVLQLPFGGDFYRLELAAGDGVLLETALPVAGPSAPMNTLDAQITVYDPNGLLVGTDQDSAVGLNASIGFVAAADGVYTVQVTAEEGEGDYLLRSTPATFLLPGDFNRDGIVNTADFTVWRDQLSQSSASYAGADASGDGLVDVGDYSLWRANFGLTLATARPDQLVLLEAAESASVAAADAIDDALATSFVDEPISARSPWRFSFRGFFDAATQSAVERDGSEASNPGTPAAPAGDDESALLMAALDSVSTGDERGPKTEELASPDEVEEFESQIDEAVADLPWSV
ncbi:MAG: Ig-like domain-containing protein [Planctomycetota bacterium]